MMASFLRISAVARKEFRHLKRDRPSQGMVLGIPLMMTLLFGYAINQDVRHLPTGVVDNAGTSGSRLLLAQAQATALVDIVLHADSAAALERRLAQGRISIGIVIPADFEARRLRGDRPVAQLLVDGSDPVVLSAARGLMGLPANASAPPIPGFELRALYNPNTMSCKLTLDSNDPG